MKNFFKNRLSSKFKYNLSVVLAAFIIVGCICVVLTITFLKHSVEQGGLFIAPAFQKSLLNSYKPKTGDILMMHYATHGMMWIPVAQHWPTHAAFVWVKDNGDVWVLECTKFSAPALPNLLKETRDKKRGVRAVKWEEYVNALDNVLYIRELVSGHIESSAVSKELYDWAIHLDFETRIADSFDTGVTIAIGFAPVWPKLSEWCAKRAGFNLHDKRKNQAFCSEFVAKLLFSLGGLDGDFENLYQFTPASFLKSVGFLEKHSSKNRLGLKWGEDRMIVRR